MKLSDVFEVNGKDLCWKKTGKAAGCIWQAPNNRAKYVQVQHQGKKYYAHRVVWEMLNGPIPQEMTIDHLDGDGLNNSPENLRLVTMAENMKNLPLFIRNTSKVMGVCWNKKRQQYHARIHSKGKSVHLGFHDTILDAVAERKRAEREYGYHKNHGRS